MTTPDIERAARAIYATKAYDARLTYGASAEDVAICEEYAAAVLEALAEPGEAAVEAGALVVAETNPDCDTAVCTYRAGENCTCGYIARAAIRAARLAELGRSE